MARLSHDSERLHGYGTLQVPVVTWYKHAGLRSLYLRMPILMLCATINGYDGSLLNGLQTVPEWQECKFTLSIDALPLRSR